MGDDKDEEVMKAAQKYQLLVTLFFIIALLYLLSTLRFDLVYQGIIDSNKFLLFLGLISLFSSALTKIIRFSLVTRQYDHHISLMESSLIQMVGISIAILTPARVGEGSKAVLLNKRQGIPISTSIGIVIFERFFDMLFLSAGAFLFSLYALQTKITTLIGLFLAILIILFAAFLKHFNTFKRLIPGKYKDYFTDVKVKNHPLNLSVIGIATGGAWVFEAGLPWLLAKSMNVTVPFPLVFGVVCISTIAVVLSILPAGLGTMDLSFLFLFPIIGVARETALSILLIYRFIGILLPFLLSLIIVNYYGISLKEIRRNIEG